MKRGYLFILLFIVTSCTSTPEVSQPTQEELVVLDSLGSYAAKQLTTNLQEALLNAIMEGGPANGITVCHDTAQALTRSISAHLGGDILIRRTSSRIRNPKNRPDQYENTALEYFRNALETTDSLPSYYAQKIQHDDSVFYRYYTPLRVKGLCLNCHGKTEAITAEVHNVLNEEYPGDAATGYNEGDFRGVISVTIHRSL